jgi:hypothetical protein
MCYTVLLKLLRLLNLLKPTGYVMHHQFNIQQFYILPRCVYVFCIHLTTNSDLHHKLIGFYNRDERCLLRGKDWAFKYSSLRFVFKGLRPQTLSSTAAMLASPALLEATSDNGDFLKLIHKTQRLTPVAAQTIFPTHTMYSDARRSCT